MPNKQQRFVNVGLAATAAVSAAALVGCARAAVPASAQQAAGAAPAAGQGFVWWEAESFTSGNFPAQNPFAPVNEQETAVLSGGKWVGVEGKRDKPLFLEYTVNVPKAGAYDLYARKFWKHGPFRFKVGEGDWQSVGKDVALLDDAPIRQFVGTNWVYAGNVTVAKAGPQKVRVELTENDGAAAFDAFLLTAQPFTARGNLKPGEKYNRTEPGFFAFEPDADPFREGSPIDLRYLNEKLAGDNGFIATKGERFVHGKTGQPVRFWAVNAGGDLLNLPPGQMAYLARHLAKYGVNMVRVHTGFWKDSNIREADTEKVDKLHRFVAAMKKEGVYTSLSVYFPLWINAKEQMEDFPGYGKAGQAQHPFALLFFNKDFQDVYKGWWKAILASKNPYAGGVSLAQDPAVAFAELVNEDSYLFWTFTPYQNVPEPQMAILEKQFGDWLTKKYGGLDKAFAAWGGQNQRGDDRGAGRAGFLPLSDIFNKRDKRAQDTAAFLTESQSAFFADASAYLKNTLGYKGLVYGSNWITADAKRLGPLDKRSNAVTPGMDLMDRHGYFDVGHEGEGASYSVRQGHKFRDVSALSFAPGKPGGEPNFSLPIMDVRYNNLPSIITEINWTTPNRLRADLPLVAAGYGALQGTDGLFFFALGGPTWQQMHGKFSIQLPTIQGQFPGAALIYRKGLVQEGPPVAEVTVPREDLFTLKGAPVAAPVSLDAFRAADIPPGKLGAVKEVAAIDPLAFLTGKVTLNFADEPVAAAAPSKLANLTPFIDRERQVVRSATGQLAWNWGEGRMVVNAPQAQGVTGYLSRAGRVSLPDVAVESPLEYGSVLVVALDGKPLKTSQKMLLQVMSEDRNYGWKVAQAGGPGENTIQNIGSAPLLVRDLTGTVSLTRPDAGTLKVTPLDLSGYPAGAASTGARSIALKRDVLYYLISK